MDNEFFTLIRESALTFKGADDIQKPEKSSEDIAFDAWLQSEKDEGYTLKDQFKSCTSCGATEDDLLHDEMIICTKCGEVLARPIDTSAEYRFFGSEDRGGGDPSRIGAPFDPRLPESSLGTIILPQGNAKNMGKVRRYHQWNMLPYKERALLGAFDRLSLAANNHGLGGSVVEDAKELYVKLNGFCDRRGLSRDSLLASCVYTALKRAGSPRKPQDVGAIFSLNHASFTKAFKFFQEVLAQATQKGLLGENWTPSNLQSTRAADYVAVPLSKLPISRADYQKLLAEAQALADRAEREGMSPENTPPSLAAGIVAYVCEKWRKGEIPLARIATSCDVSLATLQKCLRRLQSILDAE
jgi:transcription initiation factor TFIIIB Brf1 subunit/transcription initiation factor TFIIB